MCATKLHAQTKLDQLIFQISRLADELAYARGLTAADLAKADINAAVKRELDADLARQNRPFTDQLNRRFRSDQQ